MSKSKSSAAVAESNTIVELDFVKEKETKGTFRYQEVKAEGAERPTVGSIYILKSAFANGAPEKLRVTISEG